MGAFAHYIEVGIPAEQAYAWWHDLANMPMIMRDVKSVTHERSDPGLAHWKMRAPLGMTLTWDTRMVDEVPNTRLAWATVDSAIVKYAGSVRFDDHGDRTGVEVTMQYEPPGGAVGRAMAHLLASPQRKVEEALSAFKQTVENDPTG